MKRSLLLLALFIAFFSCKKEEIQPNEDASEDATTTIANAETVKPTVSFTFPHNGDVLQNTVLIQVAASDASGITQVVLKIDGIKKATDKVAPYEFFWDTKQFTNNFHKLTAKATDIFGNAKTVNITVLVQNSFAVQPVEQQLIDLINAERTLRGLNALATSELLCIAARNHSIDMSTNNFFSHIGSDGSTIGSRLTDVGYAWTSAAENISTQQGEADAQAIFNGWMANTLQKNNMLATQWRDIGIGECGKLNSSDFADTFWTGVFATTQ